MIIEKSYSNVINIKEGAGYFSIANSPSMQIIKNMTIVVKQGSYEKLNLYVTKTDKYSTLIGYAAQSQQQFKPGDMVVNAAGNNFVNANTPVVLMPLYEGFQIYTYQPTLELPEAFQFTISYLEFQRDSTFTSMFSSTDYQLISGTDYSNPFNLITNENPYPLIVNSLFFVNPSVYSTNTTLNFLCDDNPISPLYPLNTAFTATPITVNQPLYLMPPKGRGNISLSFKLSSDFSDFGSIPPAIYLSYYGDPLNV